MVRFYSLLLLLNLILGAISYSIWLHLENTEKEIAIISTVNIKNKKPVSGPTLITKNKQINIKKEIKAGNNNVLDTFLNKYGNNLQVKLSKKGKLESATGNPRADSNNVNGFRPNDSRAVINRAQEILNHAKDHIDFKKDFPLDDYKVQIGNFTAQVFFIETHKKVPLEPRGSVSVDLGPKGELLRFDNDYVSDLKILNKDLLSIVQAKNFLLKNETWITNNIIASERKILWVVTQNAALWAYEFFIKGYKFVVDAETGAVILKKDERI